MTPQATPPESSLLLRSPVLGIDPSILNLGFCVLDADGHIISMAQVGQTTDSGIPYPRRALDMAFMIERMLFTIGGYTDLDVYIEVPDNWFDDRGQTAKDSEAVQKLYLSVGAMIARLTSIANIRSIWGATPIAWKGNVPKEVMRKRAFKYAGQKGVMLGDNTPHDACEALLIARRGLRERNKEDGFDPVFFCIYERGSVDTGTFEIDTFVDPPTDAERAFHDGQPRDP